MSTKKRVNRLGFVLCRMEEVGAIWCDYLEMKKKTSLSRLATKKMDGHDEFLFVSVHDDVLDLDA